MFFEKEKIMTFDEFMQKQKNKKFRVQLNDKKYLEKITVFVLANLIWCEKVFAQQVNTDPINKAGDTLLNIAQSFGYWVFLIMCIIDILKSVTNGDTKNILNIISKYLVAFGSFYFLPYLFNLIKPIFK